MKLSGSKIKNFVIFTQKKAFLLFWKTETLKDSEKNFMFWRMKLYSPKNLNKTPLGETGCLSNH